jgi:hypothetical protein
MDAGSLNADIAAAFTFLDIWKGRSSKKIACPGIHQKVSNPNAVWA